MCLSISVRFLNVWLQYKQDTVTRSGDMKTDRDLGGGVSAVDTDALSLLTGGSGLGSFSSS